MMFDKILELENEIEAGLLEAVLNGKKIPHRIRRYADPALGGFFQTELGWGCLEAAAEDAAAIQAVYSDLKKSVTETEDEAAR